MLWKLLARDGRAGAAHPSRGDLRLFRQDLPERSVRRLQGEPARAAGRPHPPIPARRDAVRAFNVACIEQEGYEADDIIATYAIQAVEAGADVTIVSSDKDLMQLVQPGIIMYDTMKNKAIGEAEVIERFGVPPSKVVEVQALIGDSSDNVPGVPGIGVKTAALLINEFGDLETLLARAARDQAGQAAREPHHFRRPGAAVQGAGHPRHAMCRSTSRWPRRRCAPPETEALTAFMRKLEFTTLAPPRGRGSGRRVAGGHDAVGHAAAAEEERLRSSVAALAARRDGAAARAQGRGRLAGAARGGTREQARSASLRPLQLRDGDRGLPPRRSARMRRAIRAISPSG